MAKYDEQFKLDVVRRYLSEQQSYAEVAREVGVDYSLLRRWVAVYQLHGQGGLVRPRKRQRSSCAKRTRTCERSSIT